MARRQLEIRMAFAPIDIGVNAGLKLVGYGFAGIIDKPGLDLRCDAVPVALDIDGEFGL